jgi:hypothetical protein
MILLPGVPSSRIARISQLSFAWDAKDATLLARTGQTGTLAALSTTTVGGAITPAVGAALVAGRGQPRWSRVGALNALDLAQMTAGQDPERLTYPYASMNQGITVLLRLTPTWSAGASRATEQWVFGLGDSSLGNDWFRISRGGSSGTFWNVQRSVSGPTVQTSNGVAEPGTAPYPLDIYAYYDLAGTGFTRLSIRDAAGAVTSSTGTGTTHAPLARWSGEILGLGGVPGAILGAPIRLHAVKLALGFYTITQMDAMA